jgi:glycosyltransferase involved in cell wall biosynthesis
MTYPKVSILIPTYNQPEYLRHALESIVLQTYKDIEVIITDDSTDDSLFSVVDEFSTKLDIKYFKNSVRRGSPENWNESIGKSNGQYIKFLHHDDWFTTEHSLQAYVQALDENPHANFAFSCTNVCDTNRTILYTHCPTKRNLIQLRKNPVNLFPYNFVGAPSATIYRCKVNKLFDKNLKWVVDIDFYISILKENHKFIFIPEAAISCTYGASGQVTLECQNNKTIELFEWIYLFNKINRSIIPKFSNLLFFRNLLFKYHITSIQEIHKCGMDSYPVWIPFLIAINRIFIPVAKFVKCLIRKK